MSNQESGYIPFGSNRKSMRGAFARLKPVSTDIDFKLEKIRASCRDLYMNSPVGTAVLKRARTNIVNSGLTLQCRIDRSFLGLDDVTANAWEDTAEREFRIWSSSKNCDAYRRFDFYTLQGLAIISQLMSGDVFVLLPYVKRAGWPYELVIKLVEADFVCNPSGTQDTEKVTSGVEVSSTGEVVAYHMTDRHPYDLITPSWKRIEAFGAKSGRQNVLHIFEADRPNQRRGLPLLAPVIEPLKQLTRLGEAELMAAVITSMLTVFIETVAQNPIDGGLTDSEKISTPDEQLNSVEIGNGSVVGLLPGEKAVTMDPKRPNAAYDPFFMSIVKQIGAAIEYPWETVLLSYQSSYSAARASMIQAHRRFSMQRNLFKREFCKPIYEAFLEESILKGRLEAPGFFDDVAVRAAWSGSDWIGTGMGQINPEVETKAAVLRINNQLSTHAKEVALYDGDDFDSMLPTCKREAEMISAAGLKKPDVANEPNFPVDVEDEK